MANKELVVAKIQTESGKGLDEYLYCHNAKCEINELWGGDGNQPRCHLLLGHSRDLVDPECPYAYEDILRYRGSTIKEANTWADTHCSECEKDIPDGSFYYRPDKTGSIYDQDGVLRRFCSNECYEAYQTHEPYLSLRRMLDNLMK